MTDKEKCELRKEILIMRNYHYDNFNKWSTYFYIIIGALFVGYYEISGSNHSFILQCCILLLGLLVSACWHLSNKGYHHWEMHWSHFLLDIENQMKEKEHIYSVYYFAKVSDKDTGKLEIDNGNYFSPLKSANVSTPKIAMLMSFIIMFMWGFLLFWKVFWYVQTHDLKDVAITKYTSLGISVIASGVIIAILMFLGWKFVRCDMKEHKLRMFQKVDSDNKI